MLLLLLWLFLLSYLSIVLDAKYYNSEEAITKRVEHLRQTCEKYRHEQQLLLDENIADPSANYVQNWATKFFICVPSENGAIPWNRFFRKIHNFDLKEYGAYNHTLTHHLTPKELKNYFTESHRSVIVQHPMTRLLATYLTIFHNTDLHINSGMTNHIKLFWLKKRTDQLTPGESEPQVDTKDRPTLTFRQFVNFILFCPTDIKGCDSWFQGMNQRWKSQENYCHVCLENMEPTSIIFLEHMNEDKSYVFKQVGMKYDLIMSFKSNVNPGDKERFAIDEVTQKRYFSTLSKEEIRALHKATLLDHELFGFSPRKFLEFGK